MITDTEEYSKMKELSIFLCGDIMTGRGIDQILQHPSDPILYEPYVKDSRRYVDFAEKVSGSLPRKVSYDYVWGDALSEWEVQSPDVRIGNLETSITKSDDHWQGKSVHYRMHPENIPCLEAAQFDILSLANNHVMDWGYRGLEETLEALDATEIQYTGAGRNLTMASQPVIREIPGKGRIIFYAFGTNTCGIPSEWAATKEKSGIFLISEIQSPAMQSMVENARSIKKPGDLLVASIHWGPNWGYNITSKQSTLARHLIDQGRFDIIHGHSSHHAKGVELYRGKPIFYGCGDFLTDYEGISGYEDYRDDLPLMYFLKMKAENGIAQSLVMIPMHLKKLKLNYASEKDIRWIREVMTRECFKLGAEVRMKSHKAMELVI